LNVLQIGFRDRVGERFNGYGLHRALREGGHASRMLVVHRRSRDPGVASFGRAGEAFERGLYAAERVTALQGMLSPLALALPFRRAFREARVVHWHLVYPHFVSVPLTPWAAGLKPTVWTLHDPWATTGHCVHPLECARWLTGCGRCPDLSRNFAVWFDTTALVWRMKRAAYARARLDLVVSTAWMKARVERSPLLAHLPCHVIPFGLDLDRWPRPDRAACRARFGIAPGERVIAFRLPAGERNRVLKGVPWLLEALHRLALAGPTTLLVLEDRGLEPALAARFRVIETGWIEEEAGLAEALAAADVFVMPSLAESFGFMALEAMACGTPVVTVAGTAVEETLRPPEAGLSVPARDSAALAAALAELLGDASRRAAMGENGRRRVERDFTHARYVERHLALYESLAARVPGAAA